MPAALPAATSSRCGQCQLLLGKDEVLEKLDKDDLRFPGVRDIAQRHNIYTRDAAYVISINRVAHAAKMRGWV